MRLRDQYDGGGDPFEGDRTILWRSLPKDAVITKATFTVEPKRPPQTDGFVERLRFAAAGPTYGATIRHAGTGFVEVDFHARRTAIAFTGLTFTSPSLLAVDIGGGVYLAVSADGTIPAAAGSPYSLGGNTLPGVGALRLRMGGHAAGGDDLSTTTIDIASMPSNVMLRFGKLLPFWARTGELAVATTTPDITAAIQRALADATVENGFYLLPLTVHSDTLGRIGITIEIEYLGAVPLLPAGLREVVLPYDYASVSKTDARALQAKLPADAAILSPQTSIRIRGAFEASRVAYGPTGATRESLPVRCSATETLAQPLVPGSDVTVSGIDVLLAAEGPAAQLAMDLRADLDGKPGPASLLAKPARFDITGDPSRQRRWTNVPISPAAQLPKDKPCWVVIEGLDNNAVMIGVDTAPDQDRSVQRSTDAGFSWRLAGLKSPLLLRLRTVPDRFQMPIEFAAGAGPLLQRAALGAYDPLGKVDTVIDRPEIAAAVQSYIAQAAPAPCALGERLQNSDFSHWSVVGTAFTAVAAIQADAKSIATVDTFSDTVTVQRDLDGGAAQSMAFSADGSVLFVGTPRGVFAVEAATLAHIQLIPVRNTIALAADPTGETLYALTSKALIAIDLAGGKLRGVQASLSGGRALALSRDGRRAYLADQDAVIALDLVTGTERFRIAIAASGLALMPDGASAVAIDDKSSLLTSFDTASGTSGWSASLPQQLVPRAIAPSPDGGTYAVGASAQGSAPLSLVALDPRGRITQTQSLGQLPLDTANLGLAATPQGNRVYIANVPIAIDPAGSRAAGTGPVIAAVQIGTRQPNAWTLMAGAVMPFGSGDDPPRIEAALAEGAISQVVAVAPGCFYDLTVDAWVTPLSKEAAAVLSTSPPDAKPDAVVEVFWLDAGGVLLREDPLVLPASTRVVRQQTRLTPPPASAQAEVRIRVSGGLCVVRACSLQTSDALMQDAAWQPDPATAPVLATTDAARTIYRNVGSTDAALVQSIAVAPASDYLLDFRGTTSGGGPAAAAPAIEITYQDGTGAAAGTSQCIAIEPLGFAARSALLSIPPTSTIAQVRVVLPIGVRIEAEHLQIRPQTAVTIPCTFIAQSPGELHVAAAQIVYDRRSLQPPAAPPGGLSSPTPPGSKPGDPDCACEPCDDTAAAPAPVLAAIAMMLPPTETPVLLVPSEPTLTSISGIGPARADRLAVAGIGTVRDLATATPERVMAALAGTVAVTPALAQALIEGARAALAKNTNGGGP